MTDSQRATLGYIGPFAVFIGFMALEKSVFHSQHLYPVRCLVTIAAIALFSRPYLSFRPTHPWSSIAIGIAVFAVWIAPDALFGYRHFWLFENSLTGSSASTIGPGDQSDIFFLACRTFGSALLVPILEELFWRGWMMRWLVKPEFLKVPLGTYAPLAFWVTAILFASEHGPYWEVGLAAGIIYNWWMVRTRSLADCMLAHAVTNGALAAYVMATGAWRYWL
ncbi:MAG TPA: CAAX prenyl protease-related protein [Verrucomicrobiae bacterium]|nr:CAAX prenyl protease-related protein [Verrucomicrobiae bacterium]